LAVINSQLVTRLHLKTNSRPRWARFSPANPNLILLDVDGQGILASLPAGTIRGIPNGMLPAGWLGPTVVVSDKSGRFRLLSSVDLTSSKTMTAGAVSLPWPFGKNHRLWFDFALSETASAALRSPVPGAEIKDLPLIAREDQASVAIAPDGADRNLVDSSGHVFFRGTKKIYGFSLSPDTYKILVYYGNTEHVLFNRLIKRTTKMPSTIHAWTWLPDSSTLLGEVSLGGEPSREEVTSTDLYIYELAGAKLERIELPSPVRGVALKILDISAEGQILVEAERVFPEPAYLGPMVLELLWR